MSRDPILADDLIATVRRYLAGLGRELKPEQARLWLEALPHEATPAAVAAAFLRHARESTEIPKPAHICALLSATPKSPEKREAPPQAAPKVARAWAFVMRGHGLGDLFGSGDVSPEQAEEFMELANRQAKANNNPEAIPASMWLSEIWGRPCPHTEG